MEQPKQQTKRKNSGFYALVALLLIITIVASGLGIYAWAKYTSNVNGNATATVAKWYFDLKNTSGQSLATAGPIDLADTIDFSHVKSGTIAPGTNGQFQMVVDTRGTEVSLVYNLDITLTNCPVNLNFYSDANHTTLIPKTGNKLSFEEYLTAGQAQNYNQTINVYWDWPYETLDANDDPTAGDTQDLADKGKTVTLSIVATGTETQASASGTTVADITAENYGQYVDLGTTILPRTNGVITQTLSDGEHPAADWRVFYKDTTQGHEGVWLILADYLPVSEGTVGASVVGSIGLETDDESYEYLVWSNDSREDLIDKLNGNWSSLITGSNVAGTPGVQVKGAVDLPTWVSSWNASYASDTLHTSYETGINANPEYEDEGYDGWYIGESENPSYCYVELSNKNGYNNTSLYFPHHESVDNDTCYGYWLASPSAYDGDYVMYVSCYGDVYYYFYSDGNCGVRPVVFLPSNIALDTSGEVWTIAQ